MSCRIVFVIFELISRVISLSTAAQRFRRFYKYAKDGSLDAKNNHELGSLISGNDNQCGLSLHRMLVSAVP